MIERESYTSEGSKAIGFSHGDFGFVVQSFDDAAGELIACAEIIEQQFAMSAHRAGEFLHRFDSRSQGLGAPRIQEFAGPDGRVVFPELLELFLQKVGTHALQVVANQIAQLDALQVSEVLGALEQAPAGSFEQRLITFLRHAARLDGPHIVECEVHLGDDMEAIEDVEGMGAMLLDQVQVGLPHVRADELDAFTQLLTDQGEELLEAVTGSLLADPQQALAARLDLIDQRQILMASPY